MKTLKLILGDQLNYKHSWFKTLVSNITSLIMEMRMETDYVPHRSRKVIAFFAAMFNFACFGYFLKRTATNLKKRLLKMIYSMLGKMPVQQKETLFRQAEYYLKESETL